MPIDKKAIMDRLIEKHFNESALAKKEHLSQSHINEAIINRARANYDRYFALSNLVEFVPMPKEDARILMTLRTNDSTEARKKVVLVLERVEQLLLKNKDQYDFCPNTLQMAHFALEFEKEVVEQRLNVAA